MLHRPFQSFANRFKLKLRSRRGGWNKAKAAPGHPGKLLFVIMGVVVVMTRSLPLRAVQNEPPGNNSHFQIKYWTTEDGLPQHQISCLAQTHDGYLWIGT